MIAVNKKGENEKYTFEDLYDIIEKLRSPEGCPWDRVQTHLSLVKPMVEEAYEAVEAIEKESIPKMTEELGDVLLQVIFHCIIGEENGEFCFEDVTDRCARKMLSRHTHIFGNEHADNEDEALDNWEAAKLKEKGFSTLKQDLEDIPQTFPALMRASKAAKKIRKADSVVSDADVFGENTEYFGNTDFGDEEQVGKLLYEICRRSEKEGVEAEIALKRYTESIIKSVK
ncbi:MAG: MazG family protein [Clostridia bacterium]|nr:MazG family protein [Clostridia bacterium]